MRPERPVVMFVLLPEQTAYNASFVLARRLSTAGVRVVYIVPPVFQEVVSAQNFECVTLLPDPALPPKDDIVSIGWWRRWKESRRTFQRYHKSVYLCLDQIQEWLKVNAPSLALLDPLMWEFSPPLLQSNVPIVGFCSTLTSKFAPHFPPVFSEIQPDSHVGTWSNLRYRRAWTKILLRAFTRNLAEDWNLMTVYGPLRFRSRNIKSLVRRCGGLLQYGEYGLRLNTMDLVSAPREIDFPQVADQADRVYAGSCVDIRRRDRPFDWGHIRRTRPLIYCSLGTYSRFYAHSQQLFSAVIEAVRNDTRWQAIIQIGDAVEAEALGPLPRHILLTQHTAQLEVLEHSSLFVTHGGFGSVREGAFFGVPMIVFPCWLDQFGNAARIVHHKLGVRGDISTIDGQHMKTLMSKAMEEHIVNSAKAMRRVFLQHESCQTGFDWLVGQLSG